MNKKDLKKKLEQFKRTQDINRILEKGSIETQALLESAGEDRPAEASHAYDLISESMLIPEKKVEKRELIKRAKKNAPYKTKGKKKGRKGAKR